MGYSHNCCKFPHLIMSLLILLVSSTTHSRFAVKGRLVFKLFETPHMANEEKAFIRAQIGSRPPRCDRRCGSCGHCEAVQVPAVPLDKSKSRHFSMASMRGGEDSSNYKPMSAPPVLPVTGFVSSISATLTHSLNRSRKSLLLFF